MAVHPIFALILCGNIVEVATLIKSDPNVIKEKKSDFHNVRPLHYAVYHGQYYIVKKLLELGADVNIKDDRGWTPLHYAVSEGKSEIATLLIEYGANANSVNKFGSIPAHWAAQEGYKNIQII